MVYWFLSPQLKSNKVSCCCRNFSVGLDLRRHHWIGQYFRSSLHLYLSVWTEYTVESGCLTWIGSFQQGWGAREQKVTLSVTHYARGLSHTLALTHTHSFPNWQWKGFQGKHLIALLFSVFKLSQLTLMLTDIELCKGGGWHVIFKNVERKEIVFEQST